MPSLARLLSVLLLAAPAVAAAPAPRPASVPAIRSLTLLPAVVSLDGPGAVQTLLVTGRTGAGADVDLSARASYRSLDPKVATVTPDGRVRLAGDGTTWIEVRAGGTAAKVAVWARNARVERPLSFTNDVLPVLAKAGCTQAACHAKQGGQHGFQFSVLSYDPEADHAAIALQAEGRRICRTDPGRSLLLQKATLSVPHAGGKRFAVDSEEYRLVARWIASGAPFAAPGEPSLVRVEAQPTERVLAPKAGQRLLATAIYSDGTRRDVTGLTDFRSNEAGIAEADESGQIRTSGLPGEAALMVRYMGQVAVSRVTVPLGKPVPASAYARLPRQSFIDDLVYRKLATLNLLPSAPCDDTTFLRRASLDLIGTLPTAEETRAFLAECAAEKRSGDAATDANGGMGERGNGGKDSARAAGSPILPFSHSPIPSRKTRERLVERLLDRPEYADYWAMRWTNLLLVDRDPLFPKGAFAYDRWLRDCFRQNVPFDRFSRELVTAAGETYRDGPANFYRALATPVEQAKAISQLFLGVRMDCAQCHHHPSERWSQNDFYSMAAFFSQVRRKGSMEFEQLVYAAPEGEVNHPKTGKAMPPQPLGGPPATVEEGEDRRRALAAWMTAPENPFFARAIVNRTWAALMGPGLVEPVDDFRVTNPASNEPLLDALAKDFVAHGYDLKHLLRTIVSSAAYQRSSRAEPGNARDTRNYSRYYPKRLIAEVLLDAVGQATGVPETFQGHPAGTRAIQLWDNKLPVEFLEVFGRPSRLSVCECDRPADGSVTQVLHLMNGSGVQNRITAANGTAARLEKSDLTPDGIIEELYLSLYNRPPAPDELAAARTAFTRPGATRRTGIEDLLWTLLNSAEFLFNH